MKRWIQILMILTLVIAMLPGISACTKKKKAAKPKVQKTAEVKNGTAKAGGKGANAYDVPLRISCGSFENKFNPFLAKTEADIQAVDMTQVRLLEADRAGQIVMNGIDGELREFRGTDYTYYGIANVKIHYNRQADYTVYRITLRDDIVFSDGEPLTIDDVIFSLYAFCDKDYTGPLALRKSKIQGLSRYRKNKEKSISGIRRLNDYELKIYTDGYDQGFLEELQIPVCPLHYYGDRTAYNYAAGQFGFKRGDLSAVTGQASPMGAGAYCFVKCEGGIAYYSANELYYKGCPKTAFLYLEDMNQVASAGVENDTALISEITGDTVDVAWMPPDKANLEAVMEANGNGKLEGKTLEARSLADEDYAYACLDAKQIKVGTDLFSEQSRFLRRALATVISACRGADSEHYENAIILTDYPASVDSWLSPVQWEEAHNPYALDMDGKAVYKEDDKPEKKREAAKEAALEYLEAAGYIVASAVEEEAGEPRVTAAPLGAALQYSVWIQGGEESPAYSMMSAAAEDLQEIGISLQLVTVTEATQEQMDNVGCQIWCGLERLKADPALAGHYDLAGTDGIANKGRYTGIGADVELQENLYQLRRRIAPEKRINWMQKTYQCIFSQAVEVPLYQSRRLMVFSSKRIDKDTLPADMTAYYGLVREIQGIKMTGK